ncbi:carbon monoxide dehydrogenase [Actinoplanes sp. SE50]|uniref:FAD binding domain-containing protein n=1 Tax=unclassified Actinoplanes TaxID=2626549 RepID=UPI00023EC4C0|nr:MULTISPECIES: FAD binding domain-containing protein [unclassified Actinoplanes]AEV85864.1 carbon-monoxide dehydrogenase medium subunit [Actinoplanes sp. SE50/110]ATO84260.1 carbon monoxide dehydrogenase [Actinoplanes sp. SE50]SLM01670.1 carbon monoxide dehydrogenase [Actinoplanes sp. SE50/110]
MLTTVDYLAADSVDEVLAALADGRTSVLAGGQSLVPLVTRPGAPRSRLVDINRVAGLDTLTEVDGFLHVGALVRHRAFESDAVGGALGQLLRVVVRHIGHPPIRARGTMLGSLAYAHPAAEWPAVAVTVGARLVLDGPAGRRTVPAGDFFTGPFQTIRRPEEMLIEAELPVLPGGTGIGYAEDRRSTTFPHAAVLAAITVTAGAISSAAICLVNSGPCPVRATAAATALLGSTFSDAAIAAAARTAAQDDTRLLAGDARRPGRRQAFEVLTRRALRQARQGAGRCG